ncbi:hypothetical protein V2A60_008583 [Cordyceps javanica]
MSSRGRRHSNPPPPRFIRAQSPGPSYPQSGRFRRRDFDEDPPAFPRESFTYDTRPPVTFDPGLYHRRSSVPPDYDEPTRGRHRRREPPAEYDRPRRAMTANYRPRSPARTRADRDDRRGPSKARKEPSRSRSVASSSQRDKDKDPIRSWWQNPLVRTCAITALSTGLSAALDNRGDPGLWKGSKGAKVAVAAVGSAVVDGFLGSKHPGGARHTVMKKGVDVALDKTEEMKHKEQDKVEQRRSQRDRRHSTGRQSTGSRRNHTRGSSHGRESSSRKRSRH